MADMRKEQSVDDLTEDRIHQSDCGDCAGDSATDADNLLSVPRLTVSRGSGVDDRSSATESVVEDEEEDVDGDLMLERDWREDNVLQWIEALDVQVMGACRSDERLKPLLKLNACTGAAEDRLLMHLSQNFEPSEVGMLARCLCAPLVSLRVGKIDKQGALLRPTSTRGNLNLTLLPSSGLRISFVGDDGSTERMANLNTDAQCSAVEIKELEADRSGRSFALRIPDNDILYFWCSEKSMLTGIELLRKMRDLLKCKPSLSEVSGISKTRLDAFGVHLRAYLVGSTITNNALTSTSPISTSVESTDFGPIVNIQSTVLPLNSSSYRHSSNQGTKSSTHFQGSLCPKSSSFKDNSTRNSSSGSVVSREKFRQRGESYISCVDSSISFTTPSISNLSCSYNSKDIFPEPAGSFLFPFEKPGFDTPPSNPSVQIPSEALPLLSPYYCWCPPTVSSNVHQNAGTTTMPPSALPCNSESLLSSLLSNNLPSGGISTLKSPLNVLDIPTSKLPPFLPDGFPLALQTSKQIPTFTPLMCDPIVHIPVIDFCSSGQGFMVSAGPSLSTAIAPVLPNIVGRPLIPETDSAVEKGARETLRLLLSRSNELNPPLMNLLPPVLTIRDEKQNILAVGSRGLYIGTRDADAAAKSITASGLATAAAASPSETRVEGQSEMKRCASRENIASAYSHDQSDGGTCSGSISGLGFSDIGEHRSG